ncbi:MAG: NmrA family NAD(P)-binding protein [Chloroflexota bacterium]|nr:NmrA family NAD(P)-binding protein [Chloroflexota bacterium]
MILVTGAAGKTGQAVVRALLANGRTVRTLVRNETQRELISSLYDTDIVIGDMSVESVISSLFEDIRAVYHICPNMHPDELSIGLAMISAAKTADVTQFVFHSVLHPQVEAMPHHWQKMRVEEALFTSGIPFTILQPAAYMQNILVEWKNIQQEGIIRVPYSPESKGSPVDLNDVADVASLVLSDRDHIGATYELCGPDILTYQEQATILSEYIDRSIRVEQISLNEWKTLAYEAGLRTYSVESLLKMFLYYDLYGFWGSSHVLSTLLQRPPTSFIEFATNHL